MRHSTITLPMDRYSHVGLHDTAGALDKLPPVSALDPSSEPATMQATEAGGEHISNRFSPHFPTQGTERGRNVTDSDVMLGSSPQMMTGRNTLEMAALDAVRRDLTVTDGSSGGGTRTPDKRIMIPPTDRNNLLSTKNLRVVREPLATHLPHETRKMALDLALIVERWDDLPEAVRAGIVAMVQASGKGGSQ
jgi:hypothetical protein